MRATDPKSEGSDTLKETAQDQQQAAELLHPLEPDEDQLQVGENNMRFVDWKVDEVMSSDYNFTLNCEIFELFERFFLNRLDYTYC